MGVLTKKPRFQPLIAFSSYLRTGNSKMQSREGLSLQNDKVSLMRPIYHRGAQVGGEGLVIACSARFA
jgi:hypothetical protein